MQDVFERRVRAVRVASQVDAARRRANLVFERIDRAPAKLLKRFATVLLQEFVGIKLLGQREDSQIHLRGDEQLENLIRAALAGFVAVEDQIDGVGKPAQYRQMALIERSTEHGDDVAHPVLMAHHDIGVAFDDGDFA